MIGGSSSECRLIMKMANDCGRKEQLHGIRWATGSSKSFLLLFCNIDEASEYLNISREERFRRKEKRRERQVGTQKELKDWFNLRLFID